MFFDSHRRIVLALLAALSVLAGCGGGGAGLPDPRLRFVNACSDSTSLGLTVDDEPVLTSQALFGISDVGTVDTGERDVTLVESSPTSQLDALVVTFTNDTDTLIAAVGLENYGAEPLKRAQLAVTKINTQAPNGTKARLIVIQGFNRASGLNTPQVDFKNPGDNPQYVLSNIDPAAIRSFDVDSGSQTFGVYRTGTSTEYIAPSALTLEAGKIYLVMLTGVEGETGTLTPAMTLTAIN